MIIVSQNVNGLRARLKTDWEKKILLLNPDIICLQEVRAKREQLPKDFLNDYEHFYSYHVKPGYAGAAVFIKKNMNWLSKHDHFGEMETGRIQMVEFFDFSILSCYSPNVGRYLEKIDNRMKFQDELAAFVARAKEPVLICGDLNVAPEALDVGCYGIKCGVTPQERAAYRELLNLGLHDLWRERHPMTKEYTWYSNTAPKSLARGMRLDMFMASEQFLRLVVRCEQIQDEDIICGSDHVPILLEVAVRDQTM